MKNVYSLRNRLIGCYGDPIFAVQDKEQMAKDLSRFCVLEKEQAKKAHYDESELYWLGSYDDEKGAFSLQDKPVFVVAFDGCFIKKD